MKDPSRVRESWTQTFGGSSNANKVAVLEEGMKYTPMEKYLSIIAANSNKGIYLEDGTLVGHLVPLIDSRMGSSRNGTGGFQYDT